MDASPTLAHPLLQVRVEADSDTTAAALRTVSSAFDDALQRTAEVGEGRALRLSDGECEGVPHRGTQGESRGSR